MPRPLQPELPLRIVVENPVPGVSLRLQKGRAELAEPTASTPSSVAFDFTVRVAPPGPAGIPRLLGPYTQGPPTRRFVYVNAGRHAGQPDTCWDRRAKIPLTGITADLIQEALAAPGARLEVRYPGRARDGGPTCATVPLPSGAWRVVHPASHP